MTVIYIDVLFLLNFVVDYILLLATARITGEVFTRLRLALGALVGAIYAAMLFVPGLIWLSHFLCKISVAVLMILVSFGSHKRFFRVFLVFIGASTALGGLVLALQLVEAGGLTIKNGVLYTGFDLRLLLVTVILCYLGLRLAFERAARHGGARKDLYSVQIELLGKKLTLTALLDTGNTLTDPANNQPVMVVQADTLAELLPCEVDPSDPVGSMERIGDSSLKKRFRLLPYRAVGVKYGMLLAVRTDRAILAEREVNGLLVALSPTPVSDGGGYQALIGEI